MQKKTYITPTLRIREVQLTLLETMSGSNQGWGDLGAKRIRRGIPDDYFESVDEYEYFDEFYESDNNI